MTRYIISLDRTVPPSVTVDVAADVPGVVKALPMVRMIVADDLDAAQIDHISSDPRVLTVEVDQEGEGGDWQTQEIVNEWQLDRIDQRDLPMDDTYRWRRDGSGVIVYVIDSGIRASHEQFAGRIGAGFTAVGGTPWTDDQGHGTRVAGILAGSTVGVARGATISSVRVWGAGSGISTSNFADGVDWILANHPGGTPAVANVSLGWTPGSIVVDGAVQDLIDAGIQVTVAAMNNSEDAGGTSPARVADAITLAACNDDDEHRSVSNFGSVVDLYAPGGVVWTADDTSDTAYNFRSGTSYSAPLTAGVAASLLEAQPDLTPAQVRDIIVGQATPDVLTSVPSGTPNLLLNSLVTIGDEDLLPSYAWTGTHWAKVGHAGGGAGGSIAVDDDGTEVTAAASRLNFGDNLTVTDDGGGAVTIDASGGGGGAGMFCDVFGDDIETSIDVEHNLGTSCVQVGVVEVTSGDALVHGTDYTWLILDDDTVRLVFSSAPDTDDARVVVLASGGGASATGWETLYDDALTNVSEIDETLPDDFRYLRAVVVATAPPSNTAFIGLQLNGNTGNNYNAQRNRFTTSASTALSLARANFPMSFQVAPAGSQIEHVWDIAKPAANRHARINVHGGHDQGSDMVSDLVHGYWVNTSALISRVRFYLAAGTGSTFPYLSLLLEGRR